MTDYDSVDAPIDQLIWQQIEDSPCPGDFLNYLRHSPEGAVHLEEAIEKLIVLDDADVACTDDEARYPLAIAEIAALAEAGDAVAQFHMGKIHDNGIGITADGNRAEAWYQLAILQHEPRSHINLALHHERGVDAPTTFHATSISATTFSSKYSKGWVSQDGGGNQVFSARERFLAWGKWSPQGFDHCN